MIGGWAGGGGWWWMVVDGEYYSVVPWRPKSQQTPIFFLSSNRVGSMLLFGHVMFCFETRGCPRLRVI